MIGKPGRAKTCDAIMGITEEGAEIINEYKECRPWMQDCSPPLKQSSTTKFHATEL